MAKLSLALLLVLSSLLAACVGDVDRDGSGLNPPPDGTTNPTPHPPHG